MNDAINDDYIDKSQWLPRGEAFVTPERVLKGDIDIFIDDNGNMQEARSSVKNILNFLWEEDIIDDQQHHDAGTYQIWRDMHQASMGMKKPVSSGNAEALGIRLRAHGYVLVSQRMPKSHIRAVESALETFANSHTEFLARNSRRAYAEALTNLSNVIAAVKERIAYLESISEKERMELQEDGMKKLLAELNKRC